MISRKSTSFPTLHVIQANGITDPQHQTLIYLWAWALRLQDQGRRVSEHLPINFSHQLMAAFDYRCAELKVALRVAHDYAWSGMSGIEITDDD